MEGKTHQFSFAATGIGSVPFQDVEGTCREILERLPYLPFWPQFVRRSYLEDMSIQFSEGLPLLEISEEKRSLVISRGDKDRELLTFYNHFLEQDIGYFAISRNHAPGLYAMIELITREKDLDGAYIKGQTVGPVTFAAGIKDLNGRPVLHNPELLEAFVNGLAIKALWQAKELSKTNRRPVIFLDEPYLSGFGSAFSPIQRQEVIDILQTLINYIRENSDALIGIHCCGNTDWSMIAEADPDIINFDAFEHMQYFLLYPDDISRFVNKGGTVAWGIVPTTSFTGDESLEGLLSKLRVGLDGASQWGIAPHVIAQRSILTPACGMGTMAPEKAKTGLELLARLSMTCRESG
jgi:methionine synthase II (cobalamin-independent)